MDGCILPRARIVSFSGSVSRISGSRLSLSFKTLVYPPAFHGKCQVLVILVASPGPSDAA